MNEFLFFLYMHDINRNNVRFPPFSIWTKAELIFACIRIQEEKIYSLELKYGNTDVQTAIIYKGFTVHHFNFSGMTVLIFYIWSNILGFF